VIEQLPYWMNVLFIVTTALTLVFFFLANGRSWPPIILILTWSLIHSVLAYQGFYLDTSSIPPRFAFVLIPATIFIIYALRKTTRQRTLEKRNMFFSTLLHVVRIPVEIILYYLFVHEMIPDILTFEGRNFDILAGATAPLIALLVYLHRISKQMLLAWNIICLALVTFVMINGILSSELPFQQFAFDMPNRGMLYFPYILLPATIVPIVIYTHITDIVKLLKK